MKTPAFDEFALRMKSKWDAETRALKALKDAYQRAYEKLLEPTGFERRLAERPIERCTPDERLKPPCR